MEILVGALLALFAVSVVRQKEEEELVKDSSANAVDAKLAAHATQVCLDRGVRVYDVKVSRSVDWLGNHHRSITIDGESQRVGRKQATFHYD